MCFLLSPLSNSLHCFQRVLKKLTPHHEILVYILVIYFLQRSDLVLSAQPIAFFSFYYLLNYKWNFVICSNVFIDDKDRSASFCSWSKSVLLLFKPVFHSKTGAYLIFFESKSSKKGHISFRFIKFLNPFLLPIYSKVKSSD